MISVIDAILMTIGPGYYANIMYSDNNCTQPAILGSPQTLIKQSVPQPDTEAQNSGGENEEIKKT